MNQYEFENEIEVLVKVKFRAVKGYAGTWDEPGCPDEIEDIEMSCEFEDQPDDIQKSIIEQCWEATQDARDYVEECRIDAYLDRIQGVA